jgi:hypothetical protein
VDLEATVSGDVVRTVTVTKRNDGAEGPLFSFTSEIHDFGLDRDGEPLTVNIVSHEDVATVPSGRRAGGKISPRNAKALAALQNVLAGGQVTILPGNRRAAHRDHWQAECTLLGLIDSAAKPHSARTMFARFRTDLFSANRIAIEDDCDGLVPMATRERSLTASPPFPAALAVLLLSFFAFSPTQPGSRVFRSQKASATGNAEAPRKGMDFLTKSGAACPRVVKPKPVLPASIICNGLPRSPRGAPLPIGRVLSG